MNNNLIQILSCNCQGLNSVEKRRDVLDYLSKKNCNIYCLQDTHFTENDELAIKNLWGGECVFNSFTSNQRGVAIFFKKNFEYKILQTKKDQNGNLLGLNIKIEDKSITLITLYGPNNDSPEFYNSVMDVIQEFKNETVIVTGDFNLVGNQTLDTYNYQNVNNPKAKEKVLDLIEICNLIDPFRELYPTIKRYTWRKTNPVKQARLDFFLVSQRLFSNVHDVKIENSYRSDHSPVILELKLNDFNIGKGLWKFNNSLLYDKNYVKSVKEVINKVKEQYASLVYNREDLSLVDCNDIHFMINDQLFFEVLLTEIRG